MILTAAFLAINLVNFLLFAFVLLSLLGMANMVLRIFKPK